MCCICICLHMCQVHVTHVCCLTFVWFVPYYRPVDISNIWKLGCAACIILCNDATTVMIQLYSTLNINMYKYYIISWLCEWRKLNNWIPQLHSNQGPHSNLHNIILKFKMVLFFGNIVLLQCVFCIRSYTSLNIHTYLSCWSTVYAYVTGPTKMDQVGTQILTTFSNFAAS